MKENREFTVAVRGMIISNIKHLLNVLEDKNNESIQFPIYDDTPVDFKPVEIEVEAAYSILVENLKTVEKFFVS